MKLVILAAILAVIGYVVTSVAVAAMFRPITFRGIPPIFGWRGLVPAKASVIAHRLVEQIMTRVGTIRDVWDHADPRRISEHLVLSLRPRMPEIVEDVCLDADATLWDILPDDVKTSIYTRLDERMPEVIPKLLSEIEENLDDLVSIDYITTVHLIDQPGMLVRLIEHVGHKEILFLKRVGLPIGIIAALGSLIGNTTHQPWWVDGIAAATVFAVGAFLAIQVVFAWPELGTLGPFTFHGLLYQNQDNAVRVATRIFTRDIITVSNLVRDTLDGPGGDRTREIIRRHVTPLVEYGMQRAMRIIKKARSPEQVARLIDDLTNAAIDQALEPLHEPTFNRERQIVLEDVFVHKMLDLTPAQYGALIRPALGGYEWMLIPVCAAAGFIGGAAAFLFEINNPLL
ncbi:MAG: hypothetical protein LLG14_25085 [Nocardiaceae bacterium]|nr:hypothetical protein [Nocardiaceae bacterium]